jgi:hypothetical protein
LYVDVRGADYTQVNSVFPNSTIGTTHELRENVVRVGVNYKFNWGGALTQGGHPRVACAEVLEASLQA